MKNKSGMVNIIKRRLITNSGLLFAFFPKNYQHFGQSKNCTQGLTYALDRQFYYERN